MDASGWPKALGIEVDNLRAALNWAFSAAGDAEIGIELAAASASTWMGMSLLTECREWMRKAISRLDDVNSGTRQEMVIQSALASCMMFTGGMTEESYATWAKARLLAEGLKDAEHQLVCLLVLWAHQIRIPNYPEATELADRCGDVAERSGDRGAIAMANYMRGSPTTTQGGYWRPKAVSNYRCTATTKPRDSLLSSDLATTVKPMLWAFWPTWFGCAALPTMRGGLMECRSPKHANSIRPCPCVWR
jgi:hypothetical protein